MTEIGSEAFACSTLESIYCYAENPPSGNNIFNGLVYDNALLHVPGASVQAYRGNASWGQFHNIVGIDFTQEYQTELKDFLTLLTGGETLSSNLQSKLDEGLALLDRCADDAEATRVLDETCKPTLITAYASEKKSLLTAAKKGESNAYLNEVHDECMAVIEAADAAHDAGAVKRAISVGIAAVTSARILYKQLESGITPATPQGAGMRMKVTTKSGKVYEFKTSDVQSVDYYRVNE